jgi:hypothetical protein
MLLVKDNASAVRMWTSPADALHQATEAETDSGGHVGAHAESFVHAGVPLWVAWCLRYWRRQGCRCDSVDHTFGNIYVIANITHGWIAGLVGGMPR